MQYTLGTDQQAEANPIIALFTSTDYDNAWSAMVEIIKSYHGNSWTDIQLWRETGFGAQPVGDFLRNYMLMAREKQATPTANDIAIWKGNYLAKFPGSIGEDVEDFFNALMEARAAGKVTDTIFMPWTYAPTTTLQDFQAAVSGVAQTIGTAAAPVISTGVNKVLIAAVAFGVIYLLGKQFMVMKLRPR